MYPKFGFQQAFEYEYFKAVDYKNSNGGLIKLDMSQQANKDKLYRYVKSSSPFGKLSMCENADLVMFYCISFLKDNVYFIEAFNLMVVANVEENQLCIWDIFGQAKPKLDDIISLLATPEVNEVKLGFTPKDTSTYDSRRIKGDDTLFVQQGKAGVSEDNKLMFPLLSHA